MPTLKQLVDGAIKAGATWSGPSTSRIKYETEAAYGKSFTITVKAPSDGYFTVRGQTTTYVSISASFMRYQSSSYTGYTGSTLRVRKGETVAIEGSDRTSSSSESKTEVWFSPLLGSS